MSSALTAPAIGWATLPRTLYVFGAHSVGYRHNLGLIWWDGPWLLQRLEELFPRHTRIGIYVIVKTMLLCSDAELRFLKTNGSWLEQI